jgi:hypothetical protein
MPTQISQDNIQPATLAILGGGLTVTNIQITNSGYTVIDDTAVLLAGGYIKITGTNFASGCQVVLGSVNATSVTFVNSTTLNVQVPAQAAGTYVVYVVNPDGGVAIRVNGLTYSGNPTWVTGSTLPDQPANTAISIQLVATGDAPLTYAVQAGSSLPSGVALSSGGLITGSVAVGVQTLYNFTIEAIDAQSQESPRAFTVTITVGDTYWDYVTTLISANTPTTSVFVDDASTNNFPVTIAGDTRPNNFSPYTPGYYSNYFDGTGDYLSVPSNSALAFPGDFTMEAWVYFTTSGVACGFVSTYQPNTTYGTVLGMNSSNVLVFRLGVDAGGFQAVDSVAIVPGVWYHVAGVRSGNTMTLYKNGVSVGSVGSVNITSDTTTAVLGRYYTNFDNFYLTGYISNARIVKGTAVYTANFTPPTVPLTAITNTSLLTCQSNRFIDNSTNNLTLTANGNTSINGFDPFLPNISYSAYGSTYFDGTGDYLSTGFLSALANIWLNDVTVECWVYFNSVASAPHVWSIGESGAIRVTLYASSATLRLYTVVNTGGDIITSPTTLVSGQWYHIAITRSGTTWTMWLNGISQGTSTSTNRPFGANEMVALGWQNFAGGAGDYLNGYMSNFRIVIGTALYTANFAPPVAPLTAITNTSLLTCQTNQPVNNNVFIDNSTNNLFITRNGNATQGTFSPYGENWSNYFDGTGDYLSIPANSNLALGTGDFTVEWWYYPLDSGTTRYLLDIYDNNSSGRFLVQQNTNMSIGLYGASASTRTVSTADALIKNIWNHIAICRSSGITRIFSNGVQVNTNYSDSGNYTFTSTFLYFGTQNASGTNTAFGNCTNFRIVKGTALYTTNFTPSTTPLLPIAGTSLLTCKDPNIVDDSANRFTITRTGDVSVQKFGPFAATTLPTPYYSGYFDGTGDYLDVPSNAAFAFGTGNFTIECWMFNTETSTTKRTAFKFSNPLMALTTNNSIASGIGFWDGSAVRQIVFTPNVWQHIAIVRISGTLTIYLNGVNQNSAALATSIAASNVSIGAENTQFPFLGYISDFRVTNTGVYTSNFTPPTAPVTAITGTQLLTCQTNTFIDNSTNNFAITAAGNTTPSTFAPFNVTYSTLQSYTPAVFGGSSYFDGTGDNLETQNLVVLTPSTNFTAECWVYNFGFSGSQYGRGIFSFFDATANERILVRLVSTGNQVNLYANIAGGQPFGVSGTNSTLTAAPMAWTHVALVRQGSSFIVYLNGVSAITGTSAANFGNLRRIRIGGSSDGSVPDFNGYISDFRYVNGTALYTSQFVPQNSPVTAVRNTALLVNGTSAGVYDSSGMNNYETVGDAKIDTTVVKFTGTESVRFDGNGDSLTYIGGPSINFGTGDFTIELWVNMANTGTFSSFLRPDDAGSVASIGYDWSNNQLKFDARNAVILNVTTTAVVANTWTHIAVTRSGTSLILFVNGTQVGSTTNSTNFASATGLIYIGGSSFSAAHSVNGYISDFRITRGVARYTTTFTPPTSPFITY